MTKQYKVTVNQVTYEIAVEEVGGSSVPLAFASAPASAPAPTPVKPPAAVSGDGEKLTAPMPGTILSVNISVGDMVKQGQVLMILEAMKMENEILSPQDGCISSVHVAKGTAVETNSILCVIQ